MSKVRIGKPMSEYTYFVRNRSYPLQTVHTVVRQEKRNGYPNKISEPYSIKGELKKIVFYLVIFFVNLYLEKWNKEFFSEGV